MGAALGARLASNFKRLWLNLELVSQLLDPLPGSEALIDLSLRFAVADAISIVFIMALAAAALALVTVIFFTPRIQLTEKPSTNIEDAPTPMIAD